MPVAEFSHQVRLAYGGLHEVKLPAELSPPADVGENQPEMLAQNSCIARRSGGRANRLGGRPRCQVVKGLPIKWGPVEASPSPLSGFHYPHCSPFHVRLLLGHFPIAHSAHTGLLGFPVLGSRQCRSQERKRNCIARRGCSIPRF